jgi:hypothetical protein
VHFQRNEQLIVVLALGVSIFLGLCCGFGGRRWLFGDYQWCWRGFDSFFPSYEGCPKQDLCFSNGRNGCSTVGPFLYALVLIRLRLSWATASLLMAATVLASA